MNVLELEKKEMVIYGIKWGYNIAKIHINFELSSFLVTHH